MSTMEDPYHPILEQAWEYEIFTLSFWQWQHGEAEPFIDLTLKKGDVFRHFRFYSPQGLEIERGFPSQAGGFCILDVSKRGLEGVGVRVDDLAGSRGAVRFWAREVIEVGQFRRATEA